MKLIYPLILLITFGGAYIASAQISDPVISTTSTPCGPQTALVTLSDATNGATIHYTVDGTNPTASSGQTIVSGGHVLIAQNSVIKAQAFQGTAGSNLIEGQINANGSISVGTAHSLWLRSDGTLYASGDNSAGELGTGSSTPSNTPIPVLVNTSNGLVPFGNIVAIAAGANQSYAVDLSGNVWAWGDNTSGSLGVGATGNVALPTQIGGLSNIIAVATANWHTLALRSDGAVFAWGFNGDGQVGNGAITACVTTPVQVIAPSGQTGTLAGIVAISAGSYHSVALSGEGTVFCWGMNNGGQLGNGDNSGVAQSSPVEVEYQSNAFADVVGISGSASDTFAVRSDGTVWSWGDNTIGELGASPVSSNGQPLVTESNPIEVQSLSTSMVSVGDETSLGSDGTIWSWGDNTNGRLGIGSAGSYSIVPLQTSFYSGPDASLAATAGNDQTVNSGAISSPLTITLSSSGTPLANTLVNFTVSQGGGLLSLSSSGSSFSGVVQLATNAQGQATVYFMEPNGGSGNTLVAATSDGGSQDFSIISGGTGVPVLPPFLHAQTVWRR